MRKEKKVAMKKWLEIRQMPFLDSDLTHKIKRALREHPVEVIYEDIEYMKKHGDLVRCG